MALFLTAYEIWRTLDILESYLPMLGMKWRPCWEVTWKSLSVVLITGV